MANIIVRRYEHFNRSLGKYITSKKQYDQEMAKGGFVSFEKGEQLAAKNRTERQKYDGLSPEKMKFLHQVKDLADKKGNIQITDKFVEGLKKHKVIGRDLSSLPKCYREGGFE